MEKTRTSVLIVDDEIHSRILMRNIVESIDFKVIREADNGESALEFYLALNPDIVLLDIRMPGMSGSEVLQQIRQISKETCVIMLTSISNEETMRICLDYGATAYITKDTPVEGIKTTIRNCWDTMNKLKLAVY